VLRAAAPRLLARIDPGRAPVGAVAPVRFHLAGPQAAAALALAFLCQQDSRMPGAGVIRDGIRRWLIRWQMALTSGGLPYCRIARHRWLGCAESAGHVVELLRECERYETPGLAGDVGRFLSWLAQCRPGGGIEELRAAHALIAGATLVRRGPLLDAGRRRLDAVLATQHPEGWFPQARLGGDYRRQAAFSFVLARVACLGCWPQVDAALSRLIQFLAGVARPVGGAPRGEAFDATAAAVFACEKMAPRIPIAAQMARTACALCTGNHPWEHAIYCDDFVADLCASFAHAANLPPCSDDELERAGGGADPAAVIGPMTKVAAPQVRHYRGCGITVCDTPDYRAVVDLRRGGALRLWWRPGPRRSGAGPRVPVIDDGVCLTPSGERGSGLTDRPRRRLRPSRRRSRLRFFTRACAFDGYARGRDFTRTLLRRGLAWLARWRRPIHGAPGASRPRPPRMGVRPGWHCRRIICFGPHGIRIRDRITTTNGAKFTLCSPNGVVSRLEPLPLLRHTVRWYAGDGTLIADRAYSTPGR